MKTLKKYGIRIATVVMLMLGLSTLLVALTSGIHREIPKTTEKEVYFKLESLFGKLFFSRGDNDNILSADIRFDGNEHTKTNLEYNIRDNIGYLTLELNKGKKTSGDDEREVHLDDIEEGTWYLQSTGSVPLNISAELGLGRGEFDLTGLQIRSMKIEAGASSIALKCNEPNKQTIELLHLESGVGKLTADNLCNLNFREMKFDGGVGGYELDFGGTLRRDADVKLNVGLGSIRVYIPESIGAKIIYSESWVSKISLDPQFIERDENVYMTDNFKTSSARLTIRIEAGLGSIKVIRGSRI